MIGLLKMSMKLHLHLTIILSKLVALLHKSIRHSSEANFKMLLKKTVSQTIFLDQPQPIEIFNVINSLNPHKTSGYDNISSYFLRIGNKILAPVLSLFFECVFELGVFPQIFKTAKVIP